MACSYGPGLLYAETLEAALAMESSGLLVLLVSGGGGGGATEDCEAGGGGGGGGAESHEVVLVDEKKEMDEGGTASIASRLPEVGCSLEGVAPIFRLMKFVGFFA